MLTTALQGVDPLGKSARAYYGDGARPALLAMALLEAMLVEAASITDPAERQAVLNTLHIRTYEAAHGPAA